MLLCSWGTMETWERLGSMETSSQSIISLINKWPGTQLLIGPLWGEPLVTSGFHSQRASNMEIVSMTLCCHGSMETGGRLGSMETGSQSIVISLINDQELSNLLALCGRIHWSLVDSPHKWLVIWKLFPCVTELPWHYGDMWHYGNRRQGPVSLTFFFTAIQIRWKLRLAITPSLAIRSQQIFAHATTAQLSCHVQNFVAITVLESRREWNEIFIEFEFNCDGKTVSETQAGIHGDRTRVSCYHPDKSQGTQQLTSPLWGESTGYQWIPLTKGQ